MAALAGVLWRDLFWVIVCALAFQTCLYAKVSFLEFTLPSATSDEPDESPNLSESESPVIRPVTTVDVFVFANVIVPTAAATTLVMLTRHRTLKAAEAALRALIPLRPLRLCRSAGSAISTALGGLITSSSTSELFTLAVPFLVMSVGDSFFSCHVMYLVNQLACRIRTTLQGAIFRKMTQLSPTARTNNPPGYVVSILGVDCFQLATSLFLVPIPLFGLFCYPVVLVLLVARVGLGPVLFCLAWIFGAVLLPLPVSGVQSLLWKRALKARDERLKQMCDLLSSVRLVKMYAWEDARMAKIQLARDAETAHLFQINLLDGIIDSLYGASSSVMTILLFGAMTFLESTLALTPSLSFSCIYLLSLSDMVTNGASSLLRLRSQVSLGLRRILKFCAEGSNKENRSKRRGKMPNRKGSVHLEKCTFTWTQNENQKLSSGLKIGSLDIEPGTLVGVVGFVGSGKSSLLAAIMGDMHRIEGSIQVTGRIGYVPQIATVYNMTVRDNILFGQPLDLKRYDRVLHLCQLVNDLNRFPAGDLTEVGEKVKTLLPW
ncbi:hypothetical protein HPB47_022549 [Ixodes persulcatus]|uniref:Uncharacterized protein n=1 Tax=Ixodes persulcatus TaxID=34615 RepID=A0AC60QBA4_IXOPE|nr:hypothetical protein HPB47_022549 [Ixodes persulcatus]